MPAFCLAVAGVARRWVGSRRIRCLPLCHFCSLFPIRERYFFVFDFFSLNFSDVILVLIRYVYIAGLRAYLPRMLASAASYPCSRKYYQGYSSIFGFISLLFYVRAWFSGVFLLLFMSMVVFSAL